jgi:hypothetical protein
LFDVSGGTGEGSGAPTDARLSEIVRLTNLLADRVLDARIMGDPVDEADIEALLKASLLLSEFGQEAPPLLDRLIRNLRAEVAEREPR